MLPFEITEALCEWFERNRSQSLIIHSAQPLGGGSINQVYRIDTNLGIFCLKYNLGKRFPEMFETEERGLSLLRGAKVIRIPETIIVQALTNYSYLLLEFITSSQQSNLFMQDFGYALAQIHKINAVQYGLDHDNYMGALPQHNLFHDDWVSFFIEERLDNQVRLAINNKRLGKEHIVTFQHLYAQLNHFFPPEKPSLLHGDLWNGNVLVSEKGNACLIDPAVYFGHREVDLAMSILFGGFTNDFYASYQDAFPMETGWRERMDVYNLYPLLIHLNLFGSGYLSSILSVLKKF